MDRQWDIQCKAAILGFYAAIKLCKKLGLAPEDLLALVHDNVAEFEEAERMGQLIRTGGILANARAAMEANP